MAPGDTNVGSRPTSEIATAIKAMSSEAQQDSARAEALALLGFEAADPLTNAATTGHGLVAVFEHLLGLSDAQVLAILAAIAAETLDVGASVIDVLGTTLEADCAKHWQPDATLFALVRGKRVIEGMAHEVLGMFAAHALDGTQTRAKAKILEAASLGTHAETAGKTRWQPRWTRFPRASYHDKKSAATGQGKARRVATVPDMASAAP